ncbi:MAG: hypothetical protein ACYDBQ_07205 [Thermoplasmatota archaeon]
MVSMGRVRLASIFLNNECIATAEPQPAVSSLLAARGMDTDVVVLRLRFMADPAGKALKPGDTIDRTLHTSNAVFLRTVRAPPAAPPS